MTETQIENLMPEQLTVVKNPVGAEAIKFAHYLDAKTRSVPGKRSGRRTRLKLMAATSLLLEEDTFENMNVIDICNQADVAKGTFYLQFSTKEDVIHAILEEYVEFEIRTMPLLQQSSDPFETIFSFVSWYEQTFRTNAGIMRNFVRMSDHDSGIAELWKRRNEQIVERTMQTYMQHSDFNSNDVESARLMVRTMGGILDYSLFARAGINQSSDFTEGTSDGLLIELHALLIYRGLYGKDPSEQSLSRRVQGFAAGGRRNKK